MSTLKSRKEANRYLFEEALHAHLDGQAAKVRHLASLALRNEANHERLPEIEFSDTAWAFVLLIYWMLERSDYESVLEPAWRAFGRKQQGKTAISPDHIRELLCEEYPIAQNCKEHWFTLVRFLIDVMAPKVEKWEEDIRLLETIPEDFLCQDLDTLQLEILSLSLNFTLECVYDIFPAPRNEEPQPKWDLLYHKWDSYLKGIKKLQKIQNSLRNTFNRLQIQGLALLGNREYLTAKPTETIEKFWIAFYRKDTEEMQKLVNALIKIAQKDEDKFYIVQKLLNITRWVHEPFQDQFYGVYRIQRLRMERPRWLFPKLREVKFYDILDELRIQAEDGNEIPSDLSYLLRLTILIEIDALRNWDLDSYLGALRMRSKAYFFWGMSLHIPISNSVVELIRGIFYAVKTCSLHNRKSLDFKEVEKAISRLEIHEKGREAIDELVDALLHSIHPIEASSSMQVFSILTDAIPAKFIAPVLKFALENKKFCHVSLTEFSWLGDVMRWLPLDETDWNSISSIISPFFTGAQFWIDENSTMLREALLKAPLPLAQGWAKDMVELVKPNLDFYDAERGLGIIFNAALERNKLKESALQFLAAMEEKYGPKPEIQYNRALLQMEATAIIEGKENAQLCTELLSRYIKYAENISQRIEKPTSWGFNPLEWREFRRVNWSCLTTEDWEQLSQKTTSAIKNPFISDLEFEYLLTTWSAIVNQQNQGRLDTAASWLLEILNLPVSLSLKREYSIIHYHGDRVNYAKIFAGIRLLPRVSSNIAREIISWFEELIPTTEEMHLPDLWRAMLEIYIQTDALDLRLWSLNAIKSIYSRIASNTDILADGILALYAVLRQQKDVPQLTESNLAPVLKILDKSLDVLIASPNRQGRRHCALILSFLGEMGWIDETRKQWVERLKNDVRARVYSVFEAKKGNII